MILVGAIILGALIGLAVPVSIEHAYMDWLVVAIFCVGDAFLSELNVYLHKKRGTHVLTRIMFNALFGAAILFIGERLGYDLYLVVIIPFAIRTLNNLNHLKDLLSESIAEGDITIFRDRRASVRERS